MSELIMSIQNVGIRAADGFTLRDVTIDVPAGRVVGVVGDSGSGKSLLCAAITGTLVPPANVTSGEILVNGRNIATLSGEQARRQRGAIVSYIGPNPHSLLHPMIPVGKQIVRVLRSHEQLDRRAAGARVLDMLSAVGIPDPSRRFDAYPHELSGGMAQRVVIAMGLICDPTVIVADEPTFGLDVTIQAQVLLLMQQLIADGVGKSMLLSTRDLGLVANFADDVAVLGTNRIEEIGTAADFFASPSSSAGQALLESAQGAAVSA